MSLSRSRQKLGQLPFPTSLAFEPVQLCNASCFCCPYSWLKDDETYRGQTMSPENIERLLVDFGQVRTTHGYAGTLSMNPFRYSDPLVCKDLELIMELAGRFEMGTRITTNLAALTEKKTELLKRSFRVIDKISVSIIGSSEEEVHQRMSLSLATVMEKLQLLASYDGLLRSLVRISLRRLTGDEEEDQRLRNLERRIRKFGYERVTIQSDWITNRIDVAEFSEEAGRSQPSPPRQGSDRQTEERYVNGCGWKSHLLERLEVMVNGDVVLCCDNAERHAVFGNVLEDGIAKVWNGRLRREHELIMQQEYSREKNRLICGTCTRACWSNDPAGLIDVSDEEARIQRRRSLTLDQSMKRNHAKFQRLRDSLQASETLAKDQEERIRRLELQLAEFRRPAASEGTASEGSASEGSASEGTASEGSASEDLASRDAVSKD